MHNTLHLCLATCNHLDTGRISIRGRAFFGHCFIPFGGYTLHIYLILVAVLHLNNRLVEIWAWSLFGYFVTLLALYANAVYNGVMDEKG